MEELAVGRQFIDQSKGRTNVWSDLTRDVNSSPVRISWKMEDNHSIVLEVKMEVADGHVARCNRTDVDDLGILSSDQGVGLGSQLAQEHASDVLGVNDAWGTVNKFTAFNGRKPYGIRLRVNGSKNPLTMRPMASSSENPRLMR